MREEASKSSQIILQLIVEANKEDASDRDDDYTLDEKLLFNISEIKKRIIPHCRTIHPLMECLHQHLIDYIGKSTLGGVDIGDDHKEEEGKIVAMEIDEMLEISWTQLHTGHWSDVCQEWRSLHGLMCLLHSCIKLQSNNMDEWKISDWMNVIRKCDEGLMMGDDTYRVYLHQIADSTHDSIVKTFGIPSLSENNNEATKKAKISHNNDLVNRLKLDPAHAIPVEDANSISIMDFKKKYFDTQTPCLLQNASRSWEAYRKWSNINYLLEKAAYRAVPIEIGQYYTSEDWSQQIMPFHQYVKEYVLEGKTNDKIGYLAQHPLFEQIHSLRKDIQEPIYCMLGEQGELSGVNAWYGPCGTISPLHTDPYDNILVQLVGHKFVRIYHPEDTPYLYKRQSGILQANTSEVDKLYLLESEEKEKKDLYERFPLLTEANRYWDCLLHEGDMLFLPKLYWHYVQSLSVSFSISYWFK